MPGSFNARCRNLTRRARNGTGGSVRLTIQAGLHEFRVGVSECTGMTIPSDRLSPIGLNASQSPTRQKYRIERHSHPQRTPPISGLCGVLVQQARRSNIKPRKELITLSYERTSVDCRDLPRNCLMGLSGIRFVLL